MTPLVLVVSRDAMLLQTRQLILGAFFHAEGAGRVRDAEMMIPVRRYDLIILCYTLSEAECRRIVDVAAEQNRRPRILILTPAGMPPEDPGIGDAIMAEAGPYYLLKKTGEILDVDIGARESLVAV